MCGCARARACACACAYANACAYVCVRAFCLNLQTLHFVLADNVQNGFRIKYPILCLYKFSPHKSLVVI